MPRNPFKRNPLFAKFEAARKATVAAIANTLQNVATKRERGTLRSAFNASISKLGDLGGLFKALLRPRGKPLASEDEELDALDFLQTQIGGGGKKPPYEPPILLQSAPPEDGNTHRVQMDGQTREFDPSDPVMTGEMIEVTSSNVYAIGFIFNWNHPPHGTLKVQFLGTGTRGVRSGPGSLYHYEGIHPDMFAAFQRAASKGVWVWDELRIRGTVSGHQYPYKLKGGVGGYVPRQAVRYGPNEFYVPRTVSATDPKTGRRTRRTSQLPRQLVRPWNGAPNRGTPNRGGP